MRRMIRKLRHSNPEVALKIFDARITPILCYGAELWGSESRHQIEQVHIGFCKFILDLGQSAHSSAALGECGRLPSYIQYQKKYVKYWFKLLKSPENSLLYLSYKIQLQLDKLHKKGWVTNLKQLLFSNGFGHVWISQEVGDEALFLREFTLRLQDIARQNWRADLESSAKLSTYSEFKSLLNHEKYLKVVKNYFIGKQLAKLRTSNHDLIIEKGRYQGIEVTNRTCEQCDMQRVEDEYHFLLECPKYDDLRREYLPRYYVNYPNRCKYLNLISTENDTELRTLSILSIRVLIYAKAAVPNHHGPLNSDKFSMCKSDCQWVSVLAPTWRICGTLWVLVGFDEHCLRLPQHCGMGQGWLVLSWCGMC